jgi:thiol-disulfide isomerase/thioredoxin
VKRRSLVVGAAGAAAAAAGVGGYLWRTGAVRTYEPLWSLRFPQPDGGELVMAERRGKPLLLNFWATWCAPCIKEMPELDRFARDFGGRGWQVIGLAIDGPTPVREFLLKRPVGFAIGLAGMDGTDLARDLGNPQGGLPFTVVFDAVGRLVHRKLGQTSYDEVARWAGDV